MSEIRQKRYAFGDTFALSRLTLNGINFPGCPYVLEDTVREIRGVPIDEWKVAGKTAIPCGTYPLRKTWSPRWQRMMWEICDIPGYSGVRPHAGNSPEDTEGCPLTGMMADAKAGTVSRSRDARDNLYATLDMIATRGEPMWWIVEGLPDDNAD